MNGYTIKIGITEIMEIVYLITFVFKALANADFAACPPWFMDAIRLDDWFR
jgi:hypothetical protein